MLPGYPGLPPFLVAVQSCLRQRLISLPFDEDGSRLMIYPSLMPGYTEPTPLHLLEPTALAARLRHEVASALRAELGRYNDESASVSQYGKWSAKQVIGHLIDSAVNNLQRIVRLNTQPELTMPGYAQNEWVSAQGYSERTWSELVTLWTAINLHLAHAMQRVDKAHLAHVWNAEDGTITLGYLMEDYIAHLRHHLDRLPAPTTR
jgi:hypothetical protein